LQVLLAAGAAVIVAGVVILVVAATGSSTEPPATGAATVVPGDALAYVHFSTDRLRPAVRDALRLAGRLPTFSVLSGVVTSRLAAIASGSTGSGASSSLNYQDDIRPWLGKEAAIAFLETSSSRAGSEIVLDVSSLAKARAFVARSGASPAGAHRGVNRYRLRSGTELAFVRHYLVLGAPATVDGAIDAARDRASSLAGSTAYQRAATGEPATRVLDLYFSTAGITRLLAPQGGLVGALGALLYEPSELGSTVSVSAAGGEARLYVHTALQGPGGVRGRAFTPTLASELPSGSLLVLDVSGLDRVAPRVLGAGAEAGIAGRLGPLLGHLGTALASEGVNVHSIEALFSGETAVAIAPVSKGTPALVVLARVKDERKVREQLANLEVPLSQLFPTPKEGSGQVPEFSAHQVDGVSAHQVMLAPGLTLDYAVFRRLVVVSTSLGGIAAVAHHSGSLRSESIYSQTLAGQPRPVTSLVFADFSQLLRLAARTGLVRGATYQALRPDLNRIRAVGLQTARGQEDSTAQITLDIP
jgi:Protein of unknown function (DUF3352)